MEMYKKKAYVKILMVSVHSFLYLSHHTVFVLFFTVTVNTDG